MRPMLPHPALELGDVSIDPHLPNLRVRAHRPRGRLMQRGNGLRGAAQQCSACDRICQRPADRSTRQNRIDTVRVTVDRARSQRARKQTAPLAEPNVAVQRRERRRLARESSRRGDGDGHLDDGAG
jgi:hypothetical protein